MPSPPPSPTLRVPVEVLERILFFAFAPSKSSIFLPYSLDSKDSEHPPPPLVTPSSDASHLLRISTGVLQLSLPLFWSSVTIGSSRDWSLFFDPTEGLLVGEEREERRSWIEEVKLNFSPHSQIPYDFDITRRFLGGETVGDRVLVDLEAVALPNLRRIVFFEGRLEVGGSVETTDEQGNTVLLATPKDPDDPEQHDRPLRELEYEWPRGMRDDRLAPCVLACRRERGLTNFAPDYEEDLNESIEDEALDRHLEAIGMDDEEEEQEWMFEQIQINALQTRRLTTVPLFVEPSHSSQHTYQAPLDLFEDLYSSELIAWRTHTIQTSSFVCFPPAGRDPNLVENWPEMVEQLKWASKWIPFRFEGFERPLWERVRMSEECPWGEEWTWKNEEGKVELLKDVFVHQERATSAEVDELDLD